MVLAVSLILFSFSVRRLFLGGLKLVRCHHYQSMADYHELCLRSVL